MTTSGTTTAVASKAAVIVLAVLETISKGVAIVASMYRFLAVIGDEASRMRRARASRSAHAASGTGGSIVWRGRVTGALAGSLFIRAYERSERVHLAMLSRGFDGRPQATTAPRPARASLIAFVAVLGLIAIYVVLATAAATTP